MPNTSSIAFALIVGFIVFITVRGELPYYLGVVGLGSQASKFGSGSGTGSGNTLASTALGVLSDLPAIFA